MSNFSDILNGGGIRSIIMSSLIFLTVFAWVDVITQLYRDWVSQPEEPILDSNIENFMVSPHMVHDTMSHLRFKPRNPHNIKSTGDLNLKQKFGYALLHDGHNNHNHLNASLFLGYWT